MMHCSHPIPTLQAGKCQHKAEVKEGILLLIDCMYKITWEHTVLFPWICCTRIWWVACDLYLFKFLIVIVTWKALAWDVSGSDICIGGYLMLLSPFTFSNWQKWLFYLLKIMWEPVFMLRTNFCIIYFVYVTFFILFNLYYLMITHCHIFMIVQHCITLSVRGCTAISRD
jgi:hypothetical protein